MAVIQLERPKWYRRRLPSSAAFALGAGCVLLTGALLEMPVDRDQHARNPLVASPAKAGVAGVPAGAVVPLAIAVAPTGGVDPAVPAPVVGAPQDQGMKDTAALLQRLQSETAFAERMVRRLESADLDDADRHQLAFALAQADRDALVHALNRMSASPDPAQRRRAFEMLKWMPGLSPELEATVQRAALADVDPQVMASAIGALNTLGIGETGPMASTALIAPRSNEYTAHLDAAVRAASTVALVESQDDPPLAGSVLRAALADVSPAVRAAALQAVFNAGLRTPEARSLVLGVVLDGSQPEAVQAQAYAMLPSFDWAEGEIEQLGLSTLEPQ